MAAACRPGSSQVIPAAHGQAAERGSNFFLGFLFLSKAQRQALSSVYAYCRTIDDIVDSPNLDEGKARESLGFWRGEIERLYAGAGTTPLSQELVRALRLFPMPKDAFLGMIEGCEMDLVKKRYETFSELEPYLQGVAVSVGRMSVEIFGHPRSSKESLAEFCKRFGYAFQMTNIIRDVGADLDLGRVYIPESEMREAGYSREALRKKERNPAFLSLMNRLYLKTKDFYRLGRIALDPRDRPAMLPAEIMAHVYEGLLDRIQKEGFPVFSRRARLSMPRKLVLALKAWRYVHGF